MLAKSHPEGLEVPPAISIAHALIQSFVDGSLGGQPAPGCLSEEGLKKKSRLPFFPCR